MIKNDAILPWFCCWSVCAVNKTATYKSEIGWDHGEFMKWRLLQLYL